MFERHQLNKLYQYCYSLTIQEQDAFDLLQTSLEKILKQRHPIKQPLTYARRVIKHCFIDELRRTGRYTEQPIDNQTELDISTEPLEKIIIDHDQVIKILKQLKSDEREILYLWAVEGYTIEEIAYSTESSKGTLLSKIFRLRKKIIATQEDTSNSKANIKKEADLEREL